MRNRQRLGAAAARDRSFARAAIATVFARLLQQIRACRGPPHAPLSLPLLSAQTHVLDQLALAINFGFDCDRKLLG